MTFPVVADTNTGDSSGSVSTHTIQLPANISSGDLLMVFIAMEAGTSDSFSNWSDDFIEIADTNNADVLVGVAYKIATGSEGSTITVDSTNTERDAHLSLRITGHSGNAPQISSEANSDSSTDGNPDPPSFTPSGGAKDYMWIAFMGVERDSTVSVFPYTDDQLVSFLASGGTVAVCTDELNTATEDPSAFTISPNDRWKAFTFAIEPEAAADVTLTADPGSLVLSGAVAALGLGLLSGPGSLVLTGAEATLIVSDNVALTADPGSLVLTGAEATLIVSDNVTLTADPGSLVLSGAVADLVAGGNVFLTADPGSLVLSGADAALGLGLLSDPGSLVLTGAEATLIVSDNVTLTADPGSLVLSGAVADLVAAVNVILTADPGSLVLSGAVADLVESAPALVLRRGGVRFLLEPDAEIREQKVKELTALIKPTTAPRARQDAPESLLTVVSDVTSAMTPSQQTRVERLLEETGISIEELLIILQ